MNRPENVDFVLKDIKSNILDSYVNSLESRIDKAIKEIETELHDCKIDNMDGYADAFLRDLKNILKGEYMKITDKQKKVILDNLDTLENWQLEEIIEKIGIDNLDREYASELIKDILETLEEVKGVSYQDIY